MNYSINTSDLRGFCEKLRAGDRVLLSGIVFTARDAAHKRFFQLLDNGESLPFDIKDAAIYYAGPTPTPEGRVIGSCGPTTSGRMDKFSPRLLDAGLCAMIGKGARDTEVCTAIARNNAVYLCAIGGAGALAARSVTAAEVIAFPDLGCESVKKLCFDNFPLIVGTDSHGNSLFS
ncbi:MAG: FumA C-terminus/TtdB family hydratase beta subunit [Ruminococcus sp.]|jgi:fumarate hydratase subunit beta|nr:FumA C-terminus/TtdB family hydratase beta subunit [Ruminococcus sp.]